jgi:hypothetical protein
MGNERGKCLATCAAAAWLFLGVTSSAVAWGLSDEDYDYLRKTHNLERYDAPILDLSPKQRSLIHNLITDSQTSNDPAARDQNVNAVYLSHQLWEKAHPSEFWDAPGSKFPN